MSPPAIWLLIGFSALLLAGALWMRVLGSRAKLVLMSRRGCFLHLAAALAVCVSLTIANTASAQNLRGPMLLVASPDVEGSYSRAVVIAVPAGKTQHIGFIINRVSKYKLASVFPKHAPARKVVDPLYIGGPDSLGTIFVFVRATEGPPKDSIRLFEDLFVSASPKVIKYIIERTPNKARYVTGYISWFEDELEGEIESGFWNVYEPHAELLFRKDVSGLWAELTARMPRKELVSRPCDRVERRPCADNFYHDNSISEGRSQ